MSCLLGHGCNRGDKALAPVNFWTDLLVNLGGYALATPRKKAADVWKAVACCGLSLQLRVTFFSSLPMFK